MDMQWLTCIVEIPPRLLLSAKLEDIGNLQVANRKQPCTYTGVNVAGIAAVEEPLARSGWFGYMPAWVQLGLQ